MCLLDFCGFWVVLFWPYRALLAPIGPYWPSPPGGPGRARASIVVRRAMVFGPAQILGSAFGGWLYWADLREDNMINLAPGFWHFRALWCPRRAPGAPGTAPARKRPQVAPQISPGDQF